MSNVNVNVLIIKKKYFNDQERNYKWIEKLHVWLNYDDNV